MKLPKIVKELSIRSNPKVSILMALVVLGSFALGFFLERVFAVGFALDISLWGRFLPLVLSFLLTVSFLTIFSITASRAWRVVGYSLGILGFGLPFFVAPHAVSIPFPLVLLMPLSYLVALLVFNYDALRAKRIYAVFASWMFSRAYVRFFFFFAFAVGILVYFSAQVLPDEKFEIPKGILDPTLNLIIDRVIEQIQSGIGTESFSEDEFLTALKESSLLQVLEEEFDIVLEEKELTDTESLKKNLSVPLSAQLSKDLEDFLNPYLPLLPIVAAVGVAISLLFLSPVFSILSIVFFAGMYRFLIWVKFAQLEEETRQVPVLKVD